MNRAEIRRRARDFANEWADATSEQSERQPFWDAFYTVFGLARRHVAVYEEAAQRASTGRGGWIDLLQPGEMAVEHKSRGENLDAAMGQLEDYLAHLKPADVPWLLVACDFARFRWRNLETQESGEFALENLEDNLDLFWWLAGGDTPQEAGQPEVEANLQATELLAALHDELKASGYPDHDMREWLTRILFCLFADDTEVWERKLFETFIESRTADDGSDLGPQVNYVFQVLNTPRDRRSPAMDEHLSELAYVNGDLFEHPLSIPSCSETVRDALRRASRYNWGKVSPAIFGSLFQNVMTPAERRELGAHYTTEENILRTIRPLFLDELEAELESASTLPALQRFHDKLADLTFFDPACGCGNFLVIAYRELRRLETETLRRISTKQAGRSAGSRGRRTTHRAGQLVASLEFLCRVKVDQFYGIEIEEFPALIARTALYLADHLANRAVSAEFGEHYVRFPIPASPHVKIGNALEMDWNAVIPNSEVDYVFGNPPFSGHRTRTKAQSDEMRSVWGKGYAKWLDYVTSWYRRALDYDESRSVRFAFVSTNSISQGEQVARLWQPLLDAGYRIDFAFKTFAWTSEARGRAHVHVVIIGFSHGGGTSPTLYSVDESAGVTTALPAANISPYLFDGPSVVVHGRRTSLSSSMPPVRYGSLPSDGGGLVVLPDDYPTGDPVAQKYLRPYLGSQELVNGLDRWVIWMPDGPAPGDLPSSPFLRQRLAQVREARLASKNPDSQDLAETPYRFFHNAQPEVEYLGIPAQVSANRRWYTVALLPPDVIASNTLYTALDPDGFLYSILSSSMFVTWCRTIGGQLKSDLRYSGSVVHNTFPLPEANSVAEADRQRVIDAGAALRHARADAGASLADIYEPLATPPSVVAAHAEIDRAVDRLFDPRRRRWNPDDRLAVLLDAYVALMRADQLVADVPSASGARRRRRRTYD